MLLCHLMDASLFAAPVRVCVCVSDSNLFLFALLTLVVGDTWL